MPENSKLIDATFKRRVDKLLLRYLKEAGVLLVLGTDAGTGWMGLVRGFSIHDELRILTENGFTPYEVIKTGTVNAAMVVEKMNGNGDLGTIEVGKRADLLLVNNNPLIWLQSLTTVDLCRPRRRISLGCSRFSMAS